MTKRILISGIKLPFSADDGEFFREAKLCIKRAGLDSRDFSYRFHKRSLDARKREQILYVCSVIAETDADISVSEEKLKKCGASLLPSDELEIRKGTEKLSERPVIVGFGPAGIFCALLLAENGYSPIVIERGGSVAERTELVGRFYESGQLDVNTNIQFGAGGAGTFSDGKLVTRINDKNCSYVLRRFYEFGAPEEILYKAKPHIGTDILRNVVSAAAKRIEALGGEIRYHTKLEKLSGHRLITSKGELESAVTVLALGHSARDTYMMLAEQGFDLVPKPFSVGVRIEHLQTDIDRALFGELAGHPRLGVGEYNLSDTTGERGVYTFCMCPGGEVVAAASEEGGVVVNGMSRFARDGKNANSAVAVSVRTEDYGGTIEGAIAFQRELERNAFRAGGGDYSAPVQTFGDFLAGKAVTEPRRVLPTYRNGKFCRIANLNDILPAFVSENLKRGILSFDRRLRGFAAEDAVLSGVETRTSAPLRILRGEDMCALLHDGVYPCGEGAGYAGGITSAALDGMKVAMEIMRRYAPPE